MSKTKDYEITGLVISAGMSSRMGEFKPLMIFEGRTFLQQVIFKLDAVCKSIIIMTGFESEKLKTQTINSLKEQGQDSILSKLRFIKNQDYEKGMFTSLQKGMQEVRNAFPETLWVLYHFIDQPGLSDDFYRYFIAQADDVHNWIQPSFKGRQGHPILLRRDLADIILGYPETSSLREVRGNPAIKKKLWDCSFRNVLQDLDTREDYKSNTDS